MWKAREAGTLSEKQETECGQETRERGRRKKEEERRRRKMDVAKKEKWETEER